MSDVTQGKAACCGTHSCASSNVIFILLIVLIGMWLFSRYFGPANALKGQPAPVFKAKMVDGTTFNLEEHIGKRPVLLDFWAGWCPPCRKTLPNIGAVAKQYPSDQVAICTINSSEKAEEIKRFMQANNLDLPAVSDNTGAIFTQYSVRGIPMLVFIDRSGIVTEVHTGSMSESALKEKVEELLK
ncbi:MAG: TlpA family protein disulfide reductase [Candidatus Hydrogenedentes bacterium]|nr:TlpA family protein disulfide reductase [Candidatus Hydrogenedentota bacterium]